MSSFDRCLKVEAASKRLLLPWVQKNYGCTPREIEKTWDAQVKGDWVIRDENRHGYEFNVELKAEEEFTGNLFLEVVSNADLAPPRYGWLWTSAADELWYHFLDARKLYTCGLGVLRHWFLPDEGPQPIDRYRLMDQRKHVQANLTQGYPVPINVLLKECPTFREWNLREG